ncbi:MAG: hypothetical protein ACLRSW_04990 [Christensenellaceae bacterium]
MAERALERTALNYCKRGDMPALMAVIRAEEFFIPEAIKEAEKSCRGRGMRDIIRGKNADNGEWVWELFCHQKYALHSTRRERS